MTACGSTSPVSPISTAAKSSSWTISSPGCHASSLTARAGLADTLGAAHALARFAPSPAIAAEAGKAEARLAALPIEALRLAPETVLLLKRLGLRRIGELYRLPRAALQRRFRSAKGVEAVLTRLDQALGVRAEPRRPLIEPPALFVQRSWPDPLISAEQLEAETAVLAQELCAHLSARGLGARRLCLSLYRADGTVAEVRAGLSAPSWVPEHMTALLGEKLCGASMPASASTSWCSPPCRRRSRARSRARSPPRLQGGARSDATQLVDRLANRLGPAARQTYRAARQPHPRARRGARRRARARARACLAAAVGASAAAAAAAAPGADRRRRRGAGRAAGKLRVAPGRAAHRQARKARSASRRNGGTRSRRRRAARAITTASRTRGAPATGCIARAFTAATRSCRAGSCTGCSGSGMAKKPIPPRYAELQVTTNFSFLRGASHGEELVAQAHALGLAAIAVTDRNTLSGVVRAHLAAKELGLKLIVGARLDLRMRRACCACRATGRRTGGCRACCRSGRCAPRRAPARSISTMSPSTPKGQIFIALAPDDWDWRASAARYDGHAAHRRHHPLRRVQGLLHFPSPLRGRARVGGVHNLRVPAPPPPRPSPSRGREKKEKSPKHRRESFEEQLRRIKEALGGAALYLAASHTYRGDDRARIAALAALATRCGTPLVATGDVLYHAPHRRPLQDVLSCVREKTTIREAGLKLEANAERHLKRPRRWRACSAATRRRSRARWRSPRPAVHRSTSSSTNTPTSRRRPARPRRRIWRSSPGRARTGASPTASRRRCARSSCASCSSSTSSTTPRTSSPCTTSSHFARSKDILCQGRGSAANSVVCYCLAITAVNPTEIDVLFERFVSPERQRAARHRRRLRARAARGGDPVHLRALRPRPRRARRHRHLLSRALGRARRRQGDGAVGGYGRRARRHGVGHDQRRRAAGEARARGGPRSRQIRCSPRCWSWRTS